MMSVDQCQICYEKMLIELDLSLDLSLKGHVERLLAVDTSTVTATIVPVFLIITIALCDDGVLIPGSILSAQQCNEFKVPS